MAITLDEPTFVDQILYYGLLVGAIVQLGCIFAAIYIPHSEHEEEGTVEPAAESKATAQSPQNTSSRGKPKREKKKHR